MVKSAINNYKIILFVALLVHVGLLLVTRFTAWPEMLAWPYLLNEGWLPYKDIAIAHTPALIVKLALFFKVFGLGVQQLQLFTWLLTILSSLLSWLVASKLWNKKTAAYAVLFFGIYNVSYEGNGLWFDLALAPLFILIFFLVQKRKYVVAGAVWAIALFTKQTAIWLLFPIAIDLYFQGKKQVMEMEKRYVPFLYGTAIVIFICVLIMYLIGVLPYFAHWAIEFGVLYLPKASGQVDLPSLRQLLSAMIPFAPLILVVLFTKQRDLSRLLMWSAFAALGVYPRWELFHFQPSLPFLAIGTVLSVEYFFGKRLTTYRRPVIGFSLLLTLFVTGRMITRAIGDETRFFEGPIQKIVEGIKQTTSEGDKIYVINYWDSIYALSDREPAVKPLIPYIPWYLDYDNLGEYIGLEIRTNLPEIIVKGDYNDGLSRYKNQFLETTIEKHYIEVDRVDGVTIYQRGI